MTDGFELAPSSLADLKKLGEAYKAGDKALQKRTRDSLGRSGKELAAVVIREGSQEMPTRGGLQARLAASRGGVTVALAGRNVSVSIRARSREGYALRAIDRGAVRHMLFGKRKFWYTQSVPEHAYTDVFRRGSPLVQAKLRRDIQSELDQIARDAT